MIMLYCLLIWKLAVWK